MKFKKIGKRCALLSLVLSAFFFPVFSFAEIIHSTDVGGNWNDINSWEGGIIPMENDDVVLKSTIKFPAILKIKSIKLNSGTFIFRNMNMETESFEIGNNAILKTLSNSELSIQTNIFLNNGEIIYPAKINLNGKFINNGKITSTLYYSTWKSPEIKMRGDIQNNYDLDDIFYLILLPNTQNDKYRIYGSEKVSIRLDSGNQAGDYHFRGDLDLDNFLNHREDRIFLDDNRVFKFNNTKGMDIVLSNKNIIMAGKDSRSYLGFKINAKTSDIYFTQNADTSLIDVKNAYMINNSVVSFANGEVKADKIIIQEGSRVNLGSGSWYSQKHVELESDIYNHGELYFNNQNVIQGDVYNYGLIEQGLNYSDENRFKLKGDLYNYENGVIDKSFILVSKNTTTKIKNIGSINQIYLTEDMEFHPETTFNFTIQSYGKNVTLSSDTEFSGRIKGSGINFKSKNGNILNLKVNTSIAAINDSEKFNFMFYNSEPTSLVLSEDSKFNNIFVNSGSKLTIYGKTRSSFGRDSSHVNGKIINNGEIYFYTNYNRLNSYFHKTIQNNGIITGRTAWAFQDKRKFRYILSENNILTEVEKGELDNLSLVTYTIDLVPKLSEVDKIYYLHIQEAGSEEIKSEILDNKLEKIETNFNEDASMPGEKSIPSEPESGDRTKPVITLNGENKVYLLAGDIYQEEGSTATDDMDGDLTSQVEVTGTVDTSIAGDYIIYYRVSDSSNNSGINKRIVVVKPQDSNPPVITLIGDSIINLSAGDIYQELGATAIDGVDGDLTSQIEVTGTVDTTITGIYTLTYTVSDNSKNISSLQRTVRVSNGDSIIQLPQEDEPRVTKTRGSSSKKVKPKEFTCKDSRAENFSNSGIHKEELCVYAEKEEVKEESAPRWCMSGVCDVLLRGVEDKVEEEKEEELIVEEDQEEKEKEEKQILLTSTCLNILSEINFLGKSKDEIDEESTKKLQRFLKNNKYFEARIDGTYGSITKTSLKLFQSDNNLKNDGVFGKETVEWIDRNCSNIRDFDYWEKLREEEKEEESVEEEKTIEKEGEYIPRKQEASIFGAFKSEENKKSFFKERKDDWNYYLGVKKNNFCLWSELCQGADPSIIQEIFNDFSLKNDIYITGGKIWKYREVRKVNLNLIDGDNEKFNGNNVYILIHGWKTNILDKIEWVHSMKEAILENDLSAQIIYLNWHDIMKDEPHIDKVQPYTKATWIKPTAIEVSKVLKEWGIDKEKTIIIGHSMGTILGATLSSELGKVNKLIALDPAFSLPYYEIDLEETPFKNFRNKSQYTKCFVGEDSEAGSETLAKSCDEKYKIDFHDKLGVSSEHQEVVNKYREIILGDDFGEKNYLKFNSKNNFKEFNSFNGIIDVLVKKEVKGTKIEITKNQLNFLKVKKQNDLIYFGTKESNEFICWDKDLCNIYSHNGNDIFNTLIPKNMITGKMNNIYSNSYTIKDFDKNNDKIVFNKTTEKVGELSISQRAKNILVYQKNNQVIISYVYDRGGKREIGLEGVSEEKVREWISVADGSYRKTEEGRYLSEEKWLKLKENNPVIIK